MGAKSSGTLKREQTTMTKLADAISVLCSAVANTDKTHKDTSYDDLEISDIAKRYWFLKEQYAVLKEAQGELYKVLDSLDKAIFPQQLEKRGLDMVRVPELGRSFSTRTNWSASITDKERGIQWLRDNGHGDLVQETVNAGTLASFARNLQMEEGIDLPDDFFKVSTYDSMGSAKYTPKTGGK
jgi:hypothetical protein